jgi:hypothetical protein
MRILVCECKQEVSSFNPALGRYDDFVIKGGEEFLSYHRPLRLEAGGALSVFESNPELTETIFVIFIGLASPDGEYDPFARAIDRRERGCASHDSSR